MEALGLEAAARRPAPEKCRWLRWFDRRQGRFDRRNGGAGGAGGTGTGGTGGSSAGGGPGSVVESQLLGRQGLRGRTNPRDAGERGGLIELLHRPEPHAVVHRILEPVTRSKENPRARHGGQARRRRQLLRNRLRPGDTDRGAEESSRDFAPAVTIGHMNNLTLDRYHIRTDLEYKCNNSIWNASPMRSILLTDEFDALGPKGGTLDFQKQVYLMPTAPATAATSGGTYFSRSSTSTSTPWRRRMRSTTSRRTTASPATHRAISPGSSSATFASCGSTGSRPNTTRSATMRAGAAGPCRLGQSRWVLGRDKENLTKLVTNEAAEDNL